MKTKITLTKPKKYLSSINLNSINLNSTNFVSINSIVFTIIIFVISATCFMLSCAHPVLAGDYGDKDSLQLNVVVSDSYNIVMQSSKGYTDSVNITTEYFPKNDQSQSVLSRTMIPNSAVIDPENNIMNFYWQNPSGSNSFSITSNVVTNNYMPKIIDKVNFPITSLDSSFYPYTVQTNIIDITPEMKDIGSKLTTGNNDLYSTEYVLAEYVRKNVAYDLSSLTSGVDQKSSWVLENKRGVCDEITNLFISLNRGLGIPARFVSGVAYTNLDIFGSHFVPHAWAEVYFPGYGWIPYDVTYGEYGFIDSGHIKLVDSYDATGSNVKYDYIGRDVSIKPDPIAVDVNVESSGNDMSSKYSFTASVMAQNIGFNSYDIVDVDIKNDQNYYQVADMYLGETEDVDIIDDSTETVLNRTIHRREVLLNPQEEKHIYWIVHLKNDFDPNFVYTIPVTVYNSYNKTSTAFIKSRKDYNLITQNYVNAIIESKQKQTYNEYSDSILMDCNPDKNELYIGETVHISCSLDNVGDRTFDFVNICIESNCQTRSLGIQKTSFSFDKNMSKEGLQIIPIRVYNDLFSKTNYVSLNVLDKPSLNITKLKHVDIIKFDDDFSISFSITKNSVSNPKNVKIVLNNPVGKEEWSIENFNNDRSFDIKSNGKSMSPGINEYTINVSYSDNNGAMYSDEKSFIIQSDATFPQKIFLWFNVVGHWIENI